MANTRKSASRKIAVSFYLLFVMTTISLCVGCGGNGGSDSHNDLDKNFQRNVATAEAKGLPVYWLGRGFTAGDVTFDGPYGSGLGIDGDGEIGLNYIVWLEGTPFWGATTSLDLTIFSRAVWSQVENQFTNPTITGVTRRTVDVQGRQGLLLYLPLDTRPLNALQLIVDLGDVVVVAQVHADASATAGERDPNPFINDPDLLVQVMQDLRPYPE